MKAWSDEQAKSLKTLQFLIDFKLSCERWSDENPALIDVKSSCRFQWLPSVVLKRFQGRFGTHLGGKIEAWAASEARSRGRAKTVAKWQLWAAWSRANLYIYIYIYTSVLLCIYMHKSGWTREVRGRMIRSIDGEYKRIEILTENLSQILSQ